MKFPIKFKKRRSVKDEKSESIEIKPTNSNTDGYDDRKDNSSSNRVGAIKKDSQSSREVQEQKGQKQHWTPLEEEQSVQSKNVNFESSSNTAMKMDVDKRSVDNGTSMPTKLCQDRATDPKSITKTSLYSQTPSITKRDDILTSSLEYLIDNLSYPIGDSGIINTYKREIIYMLDKIIVEIQRLIRDKYTTKKVCFEKYDNAKVNVGKTSKKYKAGRSSVTRMKRFHEIRHNKMFGNIDGLDYMQLLLRSIITRMKGFDDILEAKSHNQ